MHTQMHLSRERQGQEVRALIERPHGATVTLNVQVFIRSRREDAILDYVTPDSIYVNVSTWKALHFMKTTFSPHSCKRVARTNHTMI